MPPGYAEAGNVVFPKVAGATRYFSHENTLEAMLGVISPAAVPTLRIVGALFLVINLLGAACVWRHRRRLFGRDPRVDEDREAVRYLQIVAIAVPWLSLTTRFVIERVKLWIG
jgi:hypothetical protein